MSDIDRDKDHMRIVLVASRQMVIMRLSVEEWMGVRMRVLPRIQALVPCVLFFSYCWGYQSWKQESGSPALNSPGPRFPPWKNNLATEIVCSNFRYANL